MRKTALSGLVGAVVLMGAILAPGRAVQSQEEQPPAPYLYTYSGIVDGFVIERADGTDSRILAQGVIPETHNEIYQPTWSPSGKWQAWRSAKFSGPGPSHYSGWIVSSDGSARLTMLDHSPEAVVNVSTMTWAPAADVLLVVETVADEIRDGALMRYLLIDAEAGIIRASYEFDVESIWGDPTQFSWLPDGQGAVLYKTTLGGDEQLTLEVVELRLDGTAQTAAFSAWYGLGWFSDGRLAYISPDEQQLVIKNLVDGSSHTFPLTGRPPAPRFAMHYDHLVWNHTYNVAMFYMRQEENYDLWLLDLTTQHRLFIKSDVPLPAIRSVQDGRLVASRPGAWSPDGSRYVFRTMDGSHWLFELEGRRVTLLENLPEYETITWAVNSQQLLLEDYQGVYVYDLISQESAFIPQLINAEAYSGYSEGMVYFPSPDGRYLGLTSSHTIVDLRYGSARDFSGHTAATYATAYVSYYDWHPDGLWMITAANVTFAGCCGPDAFTVLKGDPAGGDGRRELTVNWGDSTGWLPERVIPYLAAGQPESILQQPVLTRRFADTVTGLAWNPTGDQIAVHTSSGEVSIEEFNYTTGRGVRTAAFQMQARCGGLPLPCPMYWENETIVVGHEAWNPGQQIYANANNDDRIECAPYDCIERLSDAVSPDGRWRARVRDAATVEVVDTASGDIAETFERVLDMAWAGDRLVMIVAHEVLIFAADTLRSTLLESARSTGYSDRFYTMRISPDGRLVAGASPYNEIHIWNIESGDLVTVLNWYAMAIAFSPDGQRLAAGNSDLVTVWDMSAY